MTDPARMAGARAHECARKPIGDGQLASYIPELAKADPSQLAIPVHSVEGDVFEAGDTRFAVRVGLPAKSGVSGCILAVVPAEMSIAVFSPGLGPKGNSLAGIRALEVISQELELSLFD